MKKVLGILSLTVGLGLTSCQDGKLSPCADTVLAWQNKALQDGLQVTQLGALAKQALSNKQYDSAAIYTSQVVALGLQVKSEQDSAIFYTKNCPDSSK